MKNKKPIIALGALAVVGLIAGTIAYFTSEATFDNVFTTAVYKTKSEEVFNSPDNWTPGQEVEKTVVTENQGTIPVAVRVKFEETWKNESGQIIDPSVITSLEAELPNEPKKVAIINYANTSDWQYDAATKYYYFKRALAPASTNGSTQIYDYTNTPISSVTLNADVPVQSSCTESSNQGTHTTTKTCTTAVKNLGKATYTLTITVETVQYDQYKQVWFASDASNNYANAVAITPAN